MLLILAYSGHGYRSKIIGRALPVEEGWTEISIQSLNLPRRR